MEFFFIFCLHILYGKEDCTMASAVFWHILPIYNAFLRTICQCRVVIGSLLFLTVKLNISQCVRWSVLTFDSLYGKVAIEQVTNFWRPKIITEKLFVRINWKRWKFFGEIISAHSTYRSNFCWFNLRRLRAAFLSKVSEIFSTSWFSPPKQHGKLDFLTTNLLILQL